MSFPREAMEEAELAAQNRLKIALDNAEKASAAGRPTVVESHTFRSGSGMNQAIFQGSKMPVQRVDNMPLTVDSIVELIRAKDVDGRLIIASRKDRNIKYILRHCRRKGGCEEDIAACNRLMTAENGVVINLNDILSSMTINEDNPSVDQSTSTSGLKHRSTN